MFQVTKRLPLALSLVGLSLAFDISRNDNLAVYWGQNSYGVSNSLDTTNWQKNLSFYCADDTIDIIPMAFLNSFYDAGGLPKIDLSNICNANFDPVFNGTNLVNCQFLAPDIEACQAKGKIVTLSLGGALGNGTNFTSAEQASSFGDTIWNLFLGGTSDTRPFGNAVLDGIDLDIETNPTLYFDSFIDRIHALAANSTTKKYYVSAAPQCAFPDLYMGTVLNLASFDMVFVQFYNSYCSLFNFNITQDWDFSVWHTWATTKSVNKDVKVYLGSPASVGSAGPNSFVNISSLVTIIQETRDNYSSFGGVMLWDASTAYNNDRFDVAVKAQLTTTSSAGNNSTPPPSQPPASNSSAAGPAPGGPTSTQTVIVVPTTITVTKAGAGALATVTETHTVKDVAPTTVTLKTAALPATVTETATVTLTVSASPSPSSSSPPTSGSSCAGIPTWSNLVAYDGGEKVVYNGHVWTAKWWTEDDAPDGTAGDWTDDGPCTSQ